MSEGKEKERVKERLLGLSDFVKYYPLMRAKGRVKVIEPPEVYKIMDYFSFKNDVMHNLVFRMRVYVYTSQNGEWDWREEVWNIGVNPYSLLKTIRYYYPEPEYKLERLKELVKKKDEIDEELREFREKYSWRIVGYEKSQKLEKEFGIEEKREERRRITLEMAKEEAMLVDYIFKERMRITRDDDAYMNWYIKRKREELAKRRKELEEKYPWWDLIKPEEA